MARITKNLNTSGSRLDTQVLAKQTSLGEVDQSEIKDASRIQQLLSLTPEVAGVINNAILLEKAEEERKLKVKKDLEDEADRIEKQFDKEAKAEEEATKKATKDAIRSVEVGKPSADPRVNKISKGYGYQLSFNKQFNKDVEQGKYRNVTDERHLSRIKYEESNKYHQELVKKGVITEQDLLDQNFILGNEAALSNDFEKTTNLYFKNQQKVNEVDTEESINHLISMEIDKINKKYPEGSIEQQNAYNNLAINFAKKANKELGLTLSNAQANKRFTDYVLSLSKSNDNNDLPTINSLRKSLDTPYSENNPNTIASGKSDEIISIDNNINKLSNKKNSKNHDAIKTTMKNSDKFAEDGNLQGGLDILIKANASDSDIATFKSKYEDKRKSIKKVSNVKQTYITGNREDSLIAYGDLNREEKDNVLSETWNETTGGDLNTVDDFFKSDSIVKANEIKKQFGEFPPAFKDAVEFANRNYHSDGAKILALSLNNLRADGYTDGDIAEMFGVSDTDIISLTHLATGLETIDDASERDEYISNLEKTKSEVSLNVFNAKLRGTNLAIEAEAEFTAMIGKLNLKQTNYEQETKKQAKDLFAVHYLINGDLKAAGEYTFKHLNNEFFTYENSRVRATPQIKEFGITNTENLLDKSIQNIYDNTDLDNGIFGFFGSNLGVSYDSESGRHYLVDDIGTYVPTAKIAEQLQKSDNITYENGIVFINDITTETTFKK